MRGSERTCGEVYDNNVYMHTRRKQSWRSRAEDGGGGGSCIGEDRENILWNRDETRRWRRAYVPLLTSTPTILQSMFQLDKIGPMRLHPNMASLTRDSNKLGYLSLQALVWLYHKAKQPATRSPLSAKHN
ncbi:hypothetical protein Ocin01_08709 [Orchesella cincta]|uniref:Uncharacterized protein n=1 Tax=Orchesella cincta TaxID=48709 RepID=A0A1D2MYA6_ORCCI|nr:hypothetical protein Ocin01_08709 [Orchesella cincta]